MKLNIFFILIIILYFNIHAKCDCSFFNSYELKCKITKIILLGNKKSKDQIILNELTFNLNDTISLCQIEKLMNDSKINLLNLSLFNFVTISYQLDELQQITITIKLEERWYTWPSVTFDYADRNFSAWLEKGDFQKTNYGVSLDKFNFRGKNEDLKFMLNLGYEKEIMFAYKNICFGKQKKHFFGIDFSISQQNELIYKTVDNKPVTFKDSTGAMLKQKKITFNYTYRSNIQTFHRLHLNLYDQLISDTIYKLNSKFLSSGKNQKKEFSIDYTFLIDKRDSKSYPLIGSYFEIACNNSFTLPFFTESHRNLMLQTRFFKFHKINPYLFFAYAFNLSLSVNTNYSYQTSRSLGYAQNIHGFEQQVVDGQNYTTTKNIFKINILPEQVYTIKYIPFAKFNKINYSIFLNFFSDFGYVYNRYTSVANNLSNQFLYGAGFGIDLVTYYDRTLRFDYAINKFGIGGLYISFTAPLNN